MDSFEVMHILQLASNFLIIVAYLQPQKGYSKQLQMSRTTLKY